MRTQVIVDGEVAIDSAEPFPRVHFLFEGRWYDEAGLATGCSHDVELQRQSSVQFVGPCAFPDR